VIVVQKVADLNNAENISKDSRLGIPPSNEASLEIIEMHARKYHLESPQPAEDYAPLATSASKSNGKDLASLTLSSSGMKLLGR